MCFGHVTGGIESLEVETHACPRVIGPWIGPAVGDLFWVWVANSEIETGFNSRGGGALGKVCRELRGLGTGISYHCHLRALEHLLLQCALQFAYYDLTLSINRFARMTTLSRTKELESIPTGGNVPKEDGVAFPQTNERQEPKRCKRCAECVLQECICILWMKKNNIIITILFHHLPASTLALRQIISFLLKSCDLRLLPH
jgi:hypothetical protein